MKYWTFDGLCRSKITPSPPSGRVPTVVPSGRALAGTCEYNVRIVVITCLLKSPRTAPGMKYFHLSTLNVLVGCKSACWQFIHEINSTTKKHCTCILIGVRKQQTPITRPEPEFDVARCCLEACSTRRKQTLSPYLRFYCLIKLYFDSQDEYSCWWTDRQSISRRDSTPYLKRSFSIRHRHSYTWYLLMVPMTISAPPAFYSARLRQRRRKRIFCINSTNIDSTPEDIADSYTRHTTQYSAAPFAEILCREEKEIFRKLQSIPGVRLVPGPHVGLAISRDRAVPLVNF